MKHIDWSEAIFQVALWIVIGISISAMLYGYMNASKDNQELMIELLNQQQYDYIG